VLGKDAFANQREAYDTDVEKKYEYKVGEELSLE
jgi:hypothetical protein